MLISTSAMYLRTSKNKKAICVLNSNEDEVWLPTSQLVNLEISKLNPSSDFSDKIANFDIPKWLADKEEIL